mgnify:FL=1
MNVTVHLGEPFWRAVGQREVTLALGDDSVVSDALSALGKQHAALAAELANGEAKPIIFVNDEQAALDSRLADGAKIHVVWPVSGG